MCNAFSAYKLTDFSFLLFIGTTPPIISNNKSESYHQWQKDAAAKVVYADIFFNFDFPEHSNLSTGPQAGGATG